MLNKKVKSIAIGIGILGIITISFVLSMTVLNKVDKNKTKEKPDIQEEIANNKNEEKVLNISKTNYKISEYFPKNISKIVLTNYLSDTLEPTTYTIEDYSKMKEFTDLLFSTNWIFSVEPSFVTFAPADWEGTHTYFGKATIMEQ